MSALNDRKLIWLAVAVASIALSCCCCSSTAAATANLSTPAPISPSANEEEASPSVMNDERYNLNDVDVVDGGAENEEEVKSPLPPSTTNDSMTKSSNCSNRYCMTDEDYIEVMWQSVYPKPHHYKFIILHSIVFVLGLVGNTLVCLAVYRNHSMRTVTNYFIVNLAIADLLVILVCLPWSMLWDITQTWFLGALCCKIVLYMQTVSVAVSVQTLTFISIDRWYAICFPLSFKSTTSRAKTAIIIIWAIALIVDVPELWVMDTEPHPKARGELPFTQCKPTWDIKTRHFYFIMFKLVLLYTGPLIFMSIAYCQIIRVLWRSDIPGHNLSTRISTHDTDLSSQSNFGNPEGQLKSRRKAAKMLVAVVLMFAVCCLPSYLLDVYRILRHPLKNSSTFQSISSFVHLLFYANSAINPLIYNFMSGKFRKEFSRTFCCPSSGGSHGRDEYRMMAVTTTTTTTATRKSSHSVPSAAIRVPISTSRLLVLQSNDKII